MIRPAIISSGVCLCLQATTGFAQGVPTQDNTAIGQTIARVTALVQDLGTFVDGATAATSIIEQRRHIRRKPMATSLIVNSGRLNRQFGAALFLKP